MAIYQSTYGEIKLECRSMVAVNEGFGVEKKTHKPCTQRNGKALLGKLLV